MLKRCTECGAEYFARWRNEPVELCPECRVGAVICIECGALVRAPGDPAQLPLFPQLVARRPSPVDAPWPEERYWSLRQRASQAERRRSPFH